MHTRPAVLLPLLLVLMVVGAPAPTSAEPGGLARYQLENGLRVRLRPVAGAQDVAVVVLFDVGEAHDPEGQSGLAHLVEHCYVTAAAGVVPARTADQMMAAYPRRWNAQTGASYTIIAFTVPAADLESQLAEAAARMGALEPTAADIQRERPRVLFEVGQMFDGAPMLASSNRARERVRPSAQDARKGGLPEHVAGLTLEDVLRHHTRYYKPRNALLVLAGALDVEQARALVARHFAEVPAGEPLPSPRTARTATPGTLEIVEPVLPGGMLPGMVTLAYAAPEPGDEAYPAFLVALARLQARGQVGFACLDEPEVVYLRRMLTPGQDAEAVEVELRAAVAAALSAPLQAEEAGQARQSYARLLGTAPLFDFALARYPYLPGFRIGRWEQLGIDPIALGTAVGAVTSEDLQALAETWLGAEHGAAVAVVPKRDG